MRRAVFLVVWGMLLPASGRATMLVNWSLEDLLARADRVVTGTIGAQRSVEANGRVMTESVVEVERTLLGPDVRRFVLSQLGGRVGSFVVDVAGTARLVPGRRVLLITRRAEDGRWYLVGMALGAYNMDGERLEQVVDASLVKSDGTVLTAPRAREAFLADVIEAVKKGKGRQPGGNLPAVAPPEGRRDTTTVP